MVRVSERYGEERRAEAEGPQANHSAAGLGLGLDGTGTGLDWDGDRRLAHAHITPASLPLHGGAVCLRL